MTVLPVSANDVQPIGRPLKIAIAGGLQAVNVLLPAFHAVPNFQVVALAARNPDNLRAAAAQFGVPKVRAGWEPLAHDSEIDVVALALPAAIQAVAALRLAEVGKHLFCEKPLAATYADAERIVSTVAQMNRKAIVHFGFRFVSAFEAFR
ncbi:MAG TPA: Gfo/Idh/MocA family oxidoreductase, partial [Candidatus Limnocylindria bacterium]|nr:Gfo/Idh/MocA family oxidoreductase [Candidatus Limnocylindria bacterium]